MEYIIWLFISCFECLTLGASFAIGFYAIKSIMSLIRARIAKRQIKKFMKGE